MSVTAPSGLIIVRELCHSYRTSTNVHPPSSTTVPRPLIVPTCSARSSAPVRRVPETPGWVICIRVVASVNPVNPHIVIIEALVVTKRDNLCANVPAVSTVLSVK
uniref:Uncharacterized protein n=1 Tax=Cacopsylla melanoneura TaxID=428564 RepID=A0A8D9E6D9_9HEMI